MRRRATTKRVQTKDFTRSPETVFRRRLGLRVGLTRAALLWERLWLAVWPLMTTLGLFAAVVLLDVLPMLPGWLHFVVLAGFVAAFGATSALLVRRLTVPRRAEARHRLERDSGLDHRPLSSLEEKLVTPSDDPEARALWQAHQARLKDQLRQLRVRLPHPDLAAADPLALRALVALALVVGLAIGYGDWPKRLTAALSPQFRAVVAQAPASLDLWINPPAYTALPPLYLERTRRPAESATSVASAATAPAAVSVPAGSTLLAQVSGGGGVPLLQIGEEQQNFKPVGEGAYRISTELRAGDRVAVLQDGEELSAWPIELVPDAPPEVELTSAPARTRRGVLRLDYEASDDYGVVSISAMIERIDQKDQADQEGFEIELLLPGGDPREVAHSSYHDLTAHPWAGLHVDLRLAAEDAIGQRDVSYPVRFVLPERVFNHPVARALVELRKQLSLDPDDRLPVIRKLSELYGRPQHFYNDLTVALAIRLAERRLIYDPNREGVTQVQQLLWDTALHIEEGEFAVAERDLREIQEALMRALESNASDEEIARLMEQLQQALDRYLEALAEQLMEQLAQGTEMQPLPPNAEILGGDELRDMIDRARDLAQSGARDAARELLSQLREMLENMQAGLMNQQFGEGEFGAWQMMEQLDSLMRRQQELLDRSYQRSQQGDPQSGEEQARRLQDNLADAGRQENLRRELGRMMRELADMLNGMPRPLGRAEQAMRDARDALEQGQPSQAVDPQTRAVDQLQQGMQSMAEQIIEQMGNQAQRGSGQTGIQPGQGRDPLGRRWGNGNREAIEGVEIPDQMDIQRAREIL
ncbi:MAG: TIGR02302 family protein, partial [Kiloniellales bacterium]|nr:TIGR02302 family protein [Kiloniellales bacterium]